METAIDYTNYMPVAQSRGATVEAMISRQAQEVKAAMYVAKQFPRDENAAFTRIMRACERRILAENAMYEFPRGGQKVTGPSIRLAEVLAQSWGNLDFGITELEQKNGESTAMAYAWDLETNVRQTKIFVVKHERKAKGSITKLEDPRDIYELVANNGSRRLRACILGVIPGDVVDAAVEKCKQTMVNGHKGEPLVDRIKKMIAYFDSDFQVSQAMLEKYIGCKADAFSENDFVRLKNVYKALKDGMAKREDYFDVRTSSSASMASKTNVEDEFEQFLKQQEGVNADDSARQSELPLD